MTERKKEIFIFTYKVYNVIDWIISIAIIGVPVGIAMYEGMVLGQFNLESFMFYLSKAPVDLIVPVAIISTGYTIFCMWLYVRVWPIKEIPKSFQYWFDWLLTIALTAYELFIFYVIFYA